MGTGGTLAASSTPPTVRRPAPCYSGIAAASPRSSTWPELDLLAAAAHPRARLRLAGDGLAPPDRVGQGRRIRPTSSGGAGPARQRGPAGLVAGQRGHHEGAGQAWGDHVGANPVDRGKPGSKLQLVTDGQGLPLAVAVTAANVNDSTMFEGLLDDVPAVRTPSGRRRCRPDKVYADKGTTPGVAAPISAPWDHGSDRTAQDRVVDPARPPPLTRGAGPVVAELLQALADPLGSGLGAVVCLRAAGMCTHVFQPALAPMPGS
jgi:hypothetical protein